MHLYKLERKGFVMTKLTRILALLLALLMLFGTAMAEGADSEDDFADTETLEAEDIEVEGLEEDDDIVSFDRTPADITGLTPLYTTKIKSFGGGSNIIMREYQDLKSATVTTIKVGQVINIYKVYPAFVLAEYNGKVGYVIRTWIDENVTTLDPEHTIPYGVVPSQYVATLTEKVDIYPEPNKNSKPLAIHPNAGSKVAILQFINGYAEVLYWRQYGYIDATKLTDLIVVSPTMEPTNPSETPIAAFCSFFAYNTGKEGNEGRCKNIVRTTELTNKIMYPGDIMNYNSDIGPYSLANGYFKAPVLVNGGSQLGSGGGTCQASSTLFNTVRQVPGVTILYRRPHGPGCARYLPMHQDAAVGNATLNFVFRNDCEFPIRIDAHSTGEGTLCIMIYRVEE